MPRLHQPTGPLLIALLVGTNLGPTAAAQVTAAHASPLDLNFGTEIDGIAAVVNDTVITRSEVAEAARGSRFFATLASPAPTPTRAPTSEEMQASLQHLIDLALLEKSAPPPDPAVLQAELARQLDALRARVGGEEAWQRHLSAARLSEPALERLVRHQVTLLLGLDQSFHNQVQIRDAAVNRYYQSVFLPSLPAGVAPVPPLAEVRDRIVAILRQQRLDELEQQLLRDLRATAHIEIKQPEIKQP